MSSDRIFIGIMLRQSNKVLNKKLNFSTIFLQTILQTFEIKQISFRFRFLTQKWTQSPIKIYSQQVSRLIF